MGPCFLVFLIPWFIIMIVVCLVVFVGIRVCSNSWMCDIFGLLHSVCCMFCDCCLVIWLFVLFNNIKRSTQKQCLLVCGCMFRVSWLMFSDVGLMLRFMFTVFVFWLCICVLCRPLYVLVFRCLVYDLCWEHLSCFFICFFVVLLVAFIDIFCFVFALLVIGVYCCVIWLVFPDWSLCVAICCGLWIL